MVLTVLYPVYRNVRGSTFFHASRQVKREDLVCVVSTVLASSSVLATTA
jgi:hypothetical protein